MELTVEEIRTLQLAIDNLVSNGVIGQGVKKLDALHSKLEGEAQRLTKRAADFLPCGHLSSEYKELAPLSFGCASCAAKSG